jgi:hypothetical protein
LQLCPFDCSYLPVLFAAPAIKEDCVLEEKSKEVEATYRKTGVMFFSFVADLLT